MTVRISSWDGASFVSDVICEVEGDNAAELIASLEVGEYREVPTGRATYLRVRRLS